MSLELDITTPSPEQAEPMIQLRAQLFKEELVENGASPVVAAQHVAEWTTPEGVAGYQSEVAYWQTNPYMFVRIVLAASSSGSHIAGLFVAQLANEAESYHYIRSIQLHQSIRRRGIGRRLIEEFAHTTASSGLPIELDVFERNIPAQDFYAALGFVSMDRYGEILIGGKDGERLPTMRLQRPRSRTPSYATP